VIAIASKLRHSSDAQTASAVGRLLFLKNAGLSGVISSPQTFRRL
jgi:hypothetical protein